MIQPKESNSKTHFCISLIKSGVRIGAGLALCFSLIVECGTLLIFAEILGIAEEIF